MNIKRIMKIDDLLFERLSVLFLGKKRNASRKAGRSKIAVNFVKIAKMRKRKDKRINFCSLLFVSFILKDFRRK